MSTSSRLLHRRLGSTLSLPSLPSIVTRIQRACSDPGVGLRDVAALIGTDPPLCARSMRLVNSAYFGLKVPVTSIDHAVAVLGMDGIRNLVLQVAVIDLFQHITRAGRFEACSLWRDSILTGRIARDLPPRLRPRVEAEDLELAGLLHDIGKFVLLDLERERYADIVLRASSERRPLRELEREVLGFDHCQVGAVLANRWNLPELVLRCIALHHQVDDPSALVQPGVAPLILADHLAGALEKREALPRDLLILVPPQVVSQLRLQQADVRALLSSASRTLQSIAL